MQAAHPLGDADDVIRNYSGLVHHVAKRFKWALSPSLDYTDLVSEGTVGLLKAYNGFDPNKGFKFATYASRMIQWAIQQHIRQREQILRVSDRLYFLAGSILRQGMNGDCPANVARKLSCSENEAEEALNYLNLYVDSMDRPLRGTDDERVSVQYTIPTFDDHSVIEMQEFLQSLTRTERRLVELRVEGTRFSDIAKELRLSFLQVNDMLEKIQEKYRIYTEVDGMKLTKEKYLKLKEEGKSDKEIRSLCGFGEATLTRYKKEWGISGMRLPHEEKQEGEPVISFAPQPVPPAAPVPDASLQRLRDELEGMKPVLERLERENELLRVLLKNYL